MPWVDLTTTVILKTGSERLLWSQHWTSVHPPGPGATPVEAGFVVRLSPTLQKPVVKLLDNKVSPLSGI